MLPATLTAHLRASALYHVLLLALGLATLRAALLAGPLLRAADAAERAAARVDSDRYHASWLGEAHGAELDRTETMRFTPAEDLAWQRAYDVHQRYVQARRAGYLGVVPLALWAALLVLAAGSYLGRGATQVLLTTAGMMVFVALGLAYSAEIGNALVTGTRTLRRLLTDPAYVAGKWAAIGLLVVLAGCRDWLRRRRVPAPQQLRLLPAVNE